MKKLSYISIFCCFILSCVNKEDINARKLVKFEQPANFPSPSYNFENNPLTDKGILLGKKLFFDGVLSSDGSVSCGFCHEQSFAFTHHEHQFSHGVDGKIGTRNTQPIQNLAFQTSFAWDGATPFLDLFPIVPITNEKEMNETVANVVDKIKQKKGYAELYGAAFDDGQINAKNTFKALSQFMLTMVSANSKYDKFVRKEEGVVLTNQEQNGLKIFKNKCATCHQTDLFTDHSFRNNGLPIHPKLQDIGRARTSFDDADKYKFKVPSLRNVLVTAPYMHDGRFMTLEAVLNFYSDGVKETENLDPLMKKDGKLGISLTDEEKKDIIVFLKTLTDLEFLDDERFKTH